MDSSLEDPNLSYVNDKVLRFYEDLPFNSYSSAENALADFESANQIKLFFSDLGNILEKPEVGSFLDVGCGCGWLSVTAAKFYELDVHGIDFNPVAIEFASKVAELGQLPINFRQLNLFHVEQLKRAYDVVCSMGVLHHTGDTKKAFEGLVPLLSDSPHARMYIGLYHLYGRRPFLEFFKEQQAAGRTEEEMLAEFAILYGEREDPTHVLSWFRDQVLHPHESQHTLEEVAAWGAALGLEVESTSINRYQKFDSLEEVIAMEKAMEEHSRRQNIEEKTYYPGFFNVCFKRKTKKR